MVCLDIYSLPVYCDYCIHLHAYTENVLDGLAISLLLTQSNFVDDNSWKFTNDQVKLLMEHQHLMEFDK